MSSSVGKPLLKSAADVQQATASSTGVLSEDSYRKFNTEAFPHQVEVSNSTAKVDTDVYHLSRSSYRNGETDTELGSSVVTCGKEGAEEQQDAMPDSTTSSEKHNFHEGDDVLVENKDGRYYLGTVVEVRKHAGVASCLVKFGDGTHSWAAGGALRLLSAPPADDGRVMCVVCKRREGGGAAGGNAGVGDAVIACDLCGRGYHGRCHTPPVEAWIHGASWHCRRCVEQRYRVAAAENKALRRAELLRLKGHAPRRPQLATFSPPNAAWDTASTTSSPTSEYGREADQSHCYCGEKSDWLAQMLMCCRCTRWFHQRCVSSLRYPLYAGDKFFVFSCGTCNGGTEYLRRIELRWLDLAHLALYNLTAYNSRKYFDLDAVIMPYIMDNWDALQLPDKMWSLSPAERRERVMVALAGCRARFKCGREMKKRATIWGLRMRRPPPPPSQLTPIMQAGSGPLTDELVRVLAPRLRCLPRPVTPIPLCTDDDSSQPTSSNGSYSAAGKRMIVPVDGHWLNLMMGKRFHQTLNSDNDNDSPCSSPTPSDFFNNTRTGTHMMNFGLKSNDSIFKQHSSVDPDTLYTFDEEQEDGPPKAVESKMKPLKLYKMDFQGGGFVKKSVPFPKMSPVQRKKASTKNEKKRRNSSKHDDVEHKKLLRNTLTKQMKLNVELTPNNCKSVDVENDASLSPVRNMERSPSADPEIILKCDNSASSYDSSSKSSEVVLPPTPPTSVSAPPTPPTANSKTTSNSNMTESGPSLIKTDKSAVMMYDSDQDASDFRQKIRSKRSSSDIVLPCTVQLKRISTDDINYSIDNMKTEYGRVYSGKHTSKIAIMNLEISKLSTKNIIEHSKIMSLQHMNTFDCYSMKFNSNQDHESSGDETSSRGTLDAIIPPLKDFQGKNNPFLMLNNTSKNGSNRSWKCGASVASKLLNKQASGGVRGSTRTGRASLPAGAPAVRPLKRQLSEKDLVIGPNGEVKRRKHRRPRKSSQLSQSLPLPADNLRAHLGSEDLQKPTDATSPSCEDFSLTRRRLRQRQERNYYEHGRRTGLRTLQLSPETPQAPPPTATICLSELKSSVHSYFGAANRIKSGEKFSVSGKRIGENGKAQYLIEWESHGS